MRQTPRVKLQIPVRLSSNTPSNTSFHISSITELSPQGAFVSTSNTYPAGTKVSLQFDIPTPKAPQQKKIHAEAEVARLSDPRMGMGIRFLRMADDEKEMLTWFIHHPPDGNV